MFVNPEVLPESLPAADAVAWQPLHPRFVRCIQAKKLVQVTLAFTGAAALQFFSLNTAQKPWLEAWMVATFWAAFAAWTGWRLIWPAIEVPRRGYAVRDKDILYKKGLLWRSTTAVPYNRVQHAITDSAPLDRQFGLARLTVFTAGGGGGDLRIPGLGAAAAERLRVFIVGKLGNQPGAAAQEPQDGESSSWG